MALTSGFYNSINGDRTYNAEQMSSIFDGIINDGVFASIGKVFQVKVSASAQRIVSVGTGRAWFNKTWVYNDALGYIELEESDPLLDRIDAVVIEIDHSEAVRAANIKRVTGTAASSPTNPTMTNTEEVHQYPIAYIYRTAGSSGLNDSDITNSVGTSECPYVTGILQTTTIDNVVAQWQAQWNEWFDNAKTSGENDISAFLTRTQEEINTWFQQVKNTLGDDAATNLAVQIVEIQNRLDTWSQSYDSSLSTSSTNAVQNQVVTAKFNDLQTAVDSKAPSTHTHDNYLPRAGGTMQGGLRAQSNANYTTYQVRNIALSTSGGTPAENGDLLGVYE